jgi:tetratricopeptide (TPR) repeat protein
MDKKSLQALWKRIGRYNKVVEDYKRASQSSPDPGMAYINWGIDLAQSGNMSEALEKFEQAAAMSPDRPEPFNNWGVALAKQGHLDQAIEKFKQALDIEPDSINSWILWGAALLEQGNVEEAQEKYEKAVQLNPANPEPYVNWGIALSRMGRYPDAIRHFQAALAIYSYQPQVYFLWGAVLAELEQYEEAIEKFKITLRHMPKHPEAYYFWSIALNRLGQHEEAVKKSRKALELNPENPEIYLNLGDALANLGNYGLAVENYKQAAILEPELADTFMSWGIALCKMGNNEEGYRNFEKALELDETITEVHYYWGASLNENRRFQEALPHLKLVYEEDPQHLDNLINYGLSLIHTGEVDAGYQLLKEAAKLDRWNPQVHFLLGTQQLAQGNARAAMEHLQKALDVKKDFTDAAINLSLALCELGDTEEAVRTLRPFMRTQQESPEVNFFYGMILYRHGDLKEAVAKFNRALDLRPGYTEALLGLSELAIKQDHLTEAQGYLEQLLHNSPEFVPALFLSGILHARIGEQDNDAAAFQKAQDAYAKTFHHDPHHLEAHVNYAYMAGKLHQSGVMNQKFTELLEDPHYRPEAVNHYWIQALEDMGLIEEAAQKRAACGLTPEASLES